jgi:predicted pyridoxine 5'-phosphate oxidase superfamily flavin-nucleotide-binding protein
MSFGKVAFTPVVKKLQELHGSRMQYARLENSADSQDRLNEFEKYFLAERDTFYWATISSTGWPYIQHRGGPTGFLKVIDDRTLACADYRGNKQYITTGNLMSNDRVALILIDYPRQSRLKILGHVEIFEGVKAETWLPRVRVPDYQAVVERVFVIHIKAYDWNCPQHITPRYTAQEIRDAVQAVEEKSSRLEMENVTLQGDSRNCAGVRTEAGYLQKKENNNGRTTTFPAIH